MISLIFLLSFAIVPAIMINNGKPVLRHHDEDRLILYPRLVIFHLFYLQGQQLMLSHFHE